MDLMFEWMGKVVLAGGGLGLMSYLLFQTLGKKWLDSHFEARLQNLKEQGDKQIRHVQSSIDREIHRARKLYDKEFEVLSEAWERLQMAYFSALATAIETHAKLERFNPNERAALFAQLDLKQFEIDEIERLDSEAASAMLRRIMHFRTVDSCLKERQALARCLAVNGIFVMSDDVRQRFLDLDGIIVATIAEFQGRIDGRWAGDFDQMRRLTGEAPDLIEELRGIVHQRIWSASETKATA